MAETRDSIRTRLRSRWFRRILLPIAPMERGLEWVVAPWSRDDARSGNKCLFNYLGWFFLSQQSRRICENARMTESMLCPITIVDLPQSIKRCDAITSVFTIACESPSDLEKTRNTTLFRGYLKHAAIGRKRWFLARWEWGLAATPGRTNVRRSRRSPGSARSGKPGMILGCGVIGAMLSRCPSQHRETLAVSFGQPGYLLT